MGLAAPKNRIKLSHDPNNTKWTNDTQSFGHKIMAAQGWQPGQYLGAKDAAHAEFHTEANASHIRVTIKDDNLGLGAKIGSGVGHGECTGLDAFQNLLGRLNGRDQDEIEREQKSREDLKRAIYTEQRWGSIRFVKGGLLVGDKIQSLIEAEAERVRKLEQNDSSSSSDSSSESEAEAEVEPSEPRKKSKKRKLDIEEASTPVEKVKKSKKQKLANVDTVTSEVIAIKSKKEKKQKKSARPLEAMDVSATSGEVTPSEQKKSKKSRDVDDAVDDTPDEERSKERRREKKERRKREKEQKEKGKDSDAEESKKSKKKKKKSKREKQTEDGQEGILSESSRSATGTSTPLVAGSSGQSTPMMQGRHAVRARNIAQKRLASMDMASLNQIFMIKSQT